MFTKFRRLWISHPKFSSFLFATCSLLFLVTAIFLARGVIQQIFFISTNTPMPVNTNMPTLKPIAQVVRDRGYLICGVNDDQPGFSTNIHWDDDLQTPVSDDKAEGFDLDFCRVIATAIFGEYKGKVKFFNAKESTNARFDYIKQHKIDVLIRNTTWTIGRDIGLGLDFGPVILHDGQKFIIAVDIEKQPPSSADTLREYLRNKQICVKAGTTTEKNLSDLLASWEMTTTNIITSVSVNGSMKPMTTNEMVTTAFEKSLGLNIHARNYVCNVITADESQLVKLLPELAFAEGYQYHIVPDRPISYEPLAPVVIEGDEQWQELVNVSIWATIYADQLGVNQNSSITNTEVTEQKVLANAEKTISDIGNLSALVSVHQFLGIDKKGGLNPPYCPPPVTNKNNNLNDPDWVKMLGRTQLPDNFVRHILCRIGSYSDIYKRNFGDLPAHSPNQVWKPDNGGRLFFPPFR